LPKLITPGHNLHIRIYEEVQTVAEAYGMPRAREIPERYDKKYSRRRWTIQSTWSRCLEPTHAKI